MKICNVHFFIEEMIITNFEENENFMRKERTVRKVRKIEILKYYL